MKNSCSYSRNSERSMVKDSTDGKKRKRNPYHAATMEEERKGREDIIGSRLAKKISNTKSHLSRKMRHYPLERDGRESEEEEFLLEVSQLEGGMQDCS